eukprot:CAMPEP_0197517454 /NCGR_PEP_ID=MMETSP1318-20131121/2460_1 /TAXON_ID=552666 /ORGANISM="Partenskyella glossopodia, Strain RCC365" /LENGTH=372 /DNA_ID=CAMNT_0043067025 /DNA_START=402 /DNA_END=1520 /DNA_ORIENTATION=+
MASTMRTTSATSGKTSPSTSNKSMKAAATSKKNLRESKAVSLNVGLNGWEGESDPLTAFEAKMIKKLQPLDNEHSDTYRLQFIRGYENEKDTERVVEVRYKEMLTLRKDAGAVGILNCSKPEGWEEFNEVCELGVLGTTKDARPVYYERIGAYDPKKLDALGYEKLQRCHIRLQDEMLRRKELISRQLGHRMYKHVVILDMKGFGMRHMGPKVLGNIRKLMNLDNAIYPEVLKRLFIVNAPWLFQKAWSLVKGMLHPITRERIKIYGTKPKKFLPKLAEFIDIDQLPTWLGGTNKGTLNGVCSDDFDKIAKELAALEANDTSLDTGKEVRGRRASTQGSTATTKALSLSSIDSQTNVCVCECGVGVKSPACK